MTTDDLQPLTRDQLSTLSNPLRHRILDLLCRRTLTANQIRDRLDEPPSNLYYHLDKLEACGLIEVVSTQQRRGAVEKSYRAAAPGFTLPLEFLVGTGAPSKPILDTVRAMQENSLRRLAESFRLGLCGLEAKPAESFDGAARLEVPMINSLVVRTTPQRMRQLRERIDRLVRDLVDEPQPDDGELVESTLLQLFFQSARIPARNSS